MTFEFKSAVRENTPIVIGVAGPSGSGKTYSALELATGLANGHGKIAVFDTEGRRALHYAEAFTFAHAEWRPPFEPARLLDGLKSAESAGFTVIVIDSASDEHEGEGGLIDMAAAGRNANSAANWAKPKAEHKKVIRWLRQTKSHVIFCFRAEEKVRIEKAPDPESGREKTVVVPLGWQPVSEKRFLYEMTASFLMTPDKPGIPQPIKLQEQHRKFFPEGKPITRRSGYDLAQWAAGGAQRDLALILAEDAAEHGMAALQSYWESLERDDKLRLRQHLDALKARAAEVDASQREPPDPAADAGVGT